MDGTNDQCRPFIYAAQPIPPRSQLAVMRQSVMIRGIVPNAKEKLNQRVGLHDGKLHTDRLDEKNAGTETIFRTTDFKAN